MKKRYASMLALALLCGLFPLPLQAAEPAGSEDILDMSLSQLQNVVVTDTKIAQAQDTVTQKVEVVEAAEIDRHPAINHNIAELLSYRSGLFVNPLSRMDANWGSFGGLGPKYNGYLLDGLPIDSFVDAMSLDPWAFERIELYKGPASVMYSNYLSMDFAGNETPLTGTTNFVLKERIDSQLTRIQLGGGSFGTMKGKLYHQDSKGKVNYFLGGNYERSDYTNFGTSDSWLNMLEDPEYQKGVIYGNLSYLLGEGRTLKLFFHHTSHDGYVGRPNRDFDHAYDTINLAYGNQINDWLNLQLKGGYRGYDRRFGDDNFPVNLELKGHSGVEQQIFPIDLSFNIRHLENSLLTFGADTQIAEYKTYDDPSNGAKSTQNKVASTSRGLFLQEKLVLGQWVLRTGGRFNTTQHTYHTINGSAPAESTDENWSQPLWSIGARYNASQALAFYTNAGTSFVVPSAKQIWGTTNDPTADGQLPNHGLQEESGLGSDLGLEWRPMDRLAIGMRAFMNRLDDAIIDNVVSISPTQTQSVNAGEANSYGTEVMVEQTLSEGLQWFANFTYTTSKVNNPADKDNDGTDIPFVPDLLANAGITADMPWEITVTPYLHLVGSYFDSTSHSGRHEFGSYGTINIKIVRPLIKRPAGTVNTFLDVTNLTNERFEMPWGFRDPGFALFAGLEAALF